MPSQNGGRFGLSDLLMLLAVVIWGVNVSFIKISLREMTPDAFNGWRLLLTAVLFVILLAASGEGFRVGRRDFWYLAALGIAGNTIYQAIFIHGIAGTTASNTSLILSTSPIFVALLGAVLGIERIPAVSWAGILVSFAGLYLVIALSGGGLRLSSAGLGGDVWLLLGTMLWAACTVFAKPFLTRMSPLKYSALTVGIGTLAYLPLTWRDMAAVRFADVSWQAWGSLVFSGVFALVVGYIVWYYSVHKVGNARTAVYNNLTPIVAAAFAALVLGETFRPGQAVGAAVVLAGVWLTRAGRRA
ncbi:MAG: DMT family transporter [Acidobacteriota bacterium]|nr:DMT family transporter [Acidobacteriota bacterium]